MQDGELYPEAIEGIRKNILEAIEVLNDGYWGPTGSENYERAIKCRSILRRIVPVDRAMGKNLPTDLLKMQERAAQP